MNDLRSIFLPDAKGDFTTTLASELPGPKLSSCTLSAACDNPLGAMASSHKKVLVRRFTGDVLPGYLPVSSFVHEDTVRLLDLTGRVLPVSLAEIKYISYVRDFNLNDTVTPEGLMRRSFLARPRSEGVWLRLTFRTGDTLEGLAPADQILLDDVIQDLGLHLTPPDIRSNTQRLYVPRTSITHLQFLAVITSPSRRKVAPISPAESLQNDLFELPASRSRPI